MTADASLVVLTVAPLGAELGPQDTPYLPYRRADLIETAKQCEAAGAAILHLHCRTEDGVNTHAVERFAELQAAIAAETQLIVQFSTGGAIGMTAAERAEPLVLAPEMASLTCGTVNFGDEIFSNPLPLIRELAARMREREITPELEIFDYGHLTTAKRLAAEGVFHGPQHVDFVLGVPGALEATPFHLVQLVKDLPQGWTWSVAAIGRAQLQLGAIALAMGGHVRVGLEDNRMYERGRHARNEELVARMARLARELGRKPASGDEARKLLGIRSKKETGS